MTKAITEANALEVLRAHVEKFDTMTAAAEDIGVSLTFLSDVLREQSPISQKILSRLGLRRAVIRDNSAKEAS